MLLPQIAPAKRLYFFQSHFKEAKNQNRRGAPGGGKRGQKKQGGGTLPVWGANRTPVLAAGGREKEQRETPREHPQRPAPSPEGRLRV